MEFHSFHSRKAWVTHLEDLDSKSMGPIILNSLPQGKLHCSVKGDIQDPTSPKTNNHYYRYFFARYVIGTKRVRQSTFT